jgi:hypothetical protein
MLKRLTLTLGGALAATALCAPAALASNNDYYVGYPEPGSGHACTVADPCSLADALSKAADGDPNNSDTIHLPAGSFNSGSVDRIDLESSDFNHLRIVGAGADQTILNTVATATPFVFENATDISVSGVDLFGGSQASGSTVHVINADLTLNNDNVEGRDTGDNATAVQAVGNSNLTLNNTTIHMQAFEPGSGQAGVEMLTLNNTQHGSLSINDSTVDLNTSGTSTSAIAAFGDYDVSVVGSGVRVASPNAVGSQPDAIKLSGTGTPRTATITDDVIVGGDRGVDIGSAGPGGSYAVNIARDSIDAGSAGTADAPDPTSHLPMSLSLSPGASGSVSILDSAVVEHAEVADVTPNCTDLSEVLTADNSGLSGCSGLRAGAGNLASVFPADTAANVFPADTSISVRSALSTGFQPAPGSILIDDASGVGAPTRDFAGNPRIVDGNNDCVKAMDRGAIELQGHSRSVCKPTFHGSPTITGALPVGSTLTCHAPAVTSLGAAATTTFGWLRDGVQIASGPTHRIVAADADRRIACRVSASNSAGASSTTSASVTPHPTLTILAARVKIKKGKGSLAAVCNAPSGVKCRANGTIYTKGKNPRVIGTVSGKLNAGKHGSLALKLNKLGRRLLTKSHRLASVLTGSFKDSAGGRGGFGARVRLSG